jgi:hypothetical protein
LDGLVNTELDADTELVGDTDLGRGKGRGGRMEHGCDGRRESRSELASA